MLLTLHTNESENMADNLVRKSGRTKQVPVTGEPTTNVKKVVNQKRKEQPVKANVVALSLASPLHTAAAPIEFSSSSKKLKNPILVPGVTAKMLQHAAAFACMEKVTELNAMKGTSMDTKLAEYYFGSKSRETVGQIDQIVKGNGVFYNNFWQDSANGKVVNDEYSFILRKLSDVSPSMIQPSNLESNILRNATFGHNTLKVALQSGRGIKAKAMAVIREGKKASAFWEATLDINKTFESGKNEDNSLKAVRTSMWLESRISREEDLDLSDDEDNEEKTGEVKEGDDEEGEVVDETEKDIIDDVFMQETEFDNNGEQADFECDVDDENVNNDRRSKKKKVEEEVPTSYQPVWLLAWMMFGPWGSAKFNYPVSTLFSGDASTMDAGTGNGRAAQRAAKSQDDTIIRETSENRGLTATQIAEHDITKRTLDQKETALVLERDSLGIVKLKEHLNLLQEQRKMHQDIMDRIDAKTVKTDIDKERYSKAETNYWRCVDEIDALHVSPLTSTTNTGM